MDFSDAEASDPTQTFEVVENREGADYPSQVSLSLQLSEPKLTKRVERQSSRGSHR